MDERHRRLAHAGLTFNAPLSEERADSLVIALPVAPGGHVADLGCGWAELLLRVVEAHPGTTGVGVDDHRPSLDRARAEVARRGLQERVELVESDVSTFEDRADVVVCVGASHAFGGSDGALRRIRRVVEPGGLVLLGDAFWEGAPRAEARALFGEVPVLDQLVATAGTAGYAVERLETSTLEEWDRFEASWRGGLASAPDPDARALAASREREYLDVYRGVLGFAWLVLRAD